MTAKEMIEHIKKNPDISIHDVLKELPFYPLQLHKNQWVATILKKIPIELNIRLKKEYSELNEKAKLKE